MAHKDNPLNCQGNKLTKKEARGKGYKKENPLMKGKKGKNDKGKNPVK